MGAKCCPHHDGSRKKHWNGASTRPILVPLTEPRAPCIPLLLLSCFVCHVYTNRSSQPNPPLSPFLRRKGKGKCYLWGIILLTWTLMHWGKCLGGEEKAHQVFEGQVAGHRGCVGTGWIAILHLVPVQMTFVLQSIPGPLETACLSQEQEIEDLGCMYEFGLSEEHFLI